MNNNKFKSIFNKIAIKNNSFIYKYGGWFFESKNGIVLLDLQKSNYSNSYFLNIKIYINGVFDNLYDIEKKLIKDTGNIFRREPLEFKSVFDLDSNLSESERKNELEKLFNNFIYPITEISKEIKSILEYAKTDEIYILPAVKEELLKLAKSY